MKLKKLILLVPMLISLAACGGSKEKSYAGTYSFQLGSNEGTHAGIHLALSDTPAQVEGTPEAKEFTLEFNIRGDSSNSGMFGMINRFGEIIKVLGSGDKEAFDKIVDIIDDVIGGEGESSESSEAPTEPFKINGYYYTKEVEKETRLMMGLQILQDQEIDPDLLEMFLYANVSEDQVTVVIPVSIRDLLFQLYWYGYRIAGLDSLKEPVDLSEETYGLYKHHDIGTHPTADDVKQIQEYQDKREKNRPTGYELGEIIYIDYYNYHTLSMGLTKDGK